MTSVKHILESSLFQSGGTLLSHQWVSSSTSVIQLKSVVLGSHPRCEAQSDDIRSVGLEPVLARHHVSKTIMQSARCIHWLPMYCALWETQFPGNARVQRMHRTFKMNPRLFINAHVTRLDECHTFHQFLFHDVCLDHVSRTYLYKHLFNFISFGSLSTCTRGTRVTPRLALSVSTFWGSCINQPIKEEDKTSHTLPDFLRIIIIQLKSQD